MDRMFMKPLSAILTLGVFATVSAEGTNIDIFSIVDEINAEAEICHGECSADEDNGEEICKFTAKVNLHASELGYYQFEECGDVDSPTLGLEVGKTYRFIQKDPSNYMHPLGFAYYPDGAHDDKEELEPGIVPPGSTSTCNVNYTCPAPMYFLGDEYLGSYSNMNAIEVSSDYEAENFGLDDYEPRFFHPLPEWIGYGDFSVYLKFDNNTDYNKDLFYFCHIHQFMSGRIKLLKDDVPIQKEDLPELGYDYERPRGHDTACGTYGLNQFQLPHDECPEKFVCDAESKDAGMQQFSKCIDSMNCAMMAGMTSSVQGSADETALFIHQMIPHHQNAVNMAKALIKTGKLQCDDLTDEESEQAADCAMERMTARFSFSTERNLARVNEKERKKARINNRKIADAGEPSGAGQICQARCITDENTGEEMCQFTAKVNLYASELGYFQFEECGDAVNPTLGLEVGKTYQFVQKDPSNHMHPLGFAYYPDGAHDDKDELEPGIVPPGSTSTCNADFTCPAPMYFLGEEYLGSYTNIDAIERSSDYDAENFGLDDYEPKFFHPLTQWIGYGDFSVYLKFGADSDYDKDLFYFCHIHQYMSGRIKLLKDGTPIQEEDTPEIGYKYDSPSGHDIDCGTYGLNEFQLPHAECPEKFVCDTEGQAAGLQQFSKCIDSMNCAMMAGMSSSVSGDIDETALFIHQMIPHHQNAVNMAKALIKTGTLQCDDLTDEESEQAADCAMEVILRSIITGQNAQIQAMRGILEAKKFPPENDCIVEAYSSDDVVSSEEEDGMKATVVKSAAPSAIFVFGITITYVISVFFLKSI
ncbi:hypothetical protein HJC23_006840 [Cyclotella cryptica]|uniref:DUF305 domain-containing protein n=1 Tax=Cyclotella cryptica TaxID=29204 RepID=A0ABD3PG82_9STRA|eukprot:CCRYP_015094-RF/>CCRYP_015094-RF protein AED:0.06 eAED:0.06 QI:646/0.83/0.57/1/0.83/0.71/7/380/814